MSIEIIDTDPVIEDCDHLWCEDGRVGDRYCPRCGGDGMRTFDRSALFTLAHNLAVAGAMQRMFGAGAYAVVRLITNTSGQLEWSPNAEGRGIR
jgi:hypothetical protein